MRPILIFCVLTLLIGCGLKGIPYSQNTDGTEPNAVAISHYKWGLAYAKQGELARAATEFKLAIQHEPGWAIPYFNLGAVYGNMGEQDQAILAWERATQLDVDFGKAHYNLAIAYSHRAADPVEGISRVADIERAIASLQEAIRLDDSVRSTAETESAFDIVRDNPEFQALFQSTEPKQ